MKVLSYLALAAAATAAAPALASIAATVFSFLPVASAVTACATCSIAATFSGLGIAAIVPIDASKAGALCCAATTTGSDQHNPISATCVGRIARRSIDDTGPTATSGRGNR